MVELLKKNWSYIAMILLALLWMNSCSSNSSNSRMVRDQAVVIDSLKNEIVETAQYKEQDFERMMLLIEKQGYEVSGRMLYDNNRVIRRTVRPDDQMKIYIDEIKKIDEKLEKLTND